MKSVSTYLQYSVGYTLGLFVLLSLAYAASANADLVIDPTFGATITSGSDGSPAAVEASIDAAISRLEAAIETPITVSIDFENNTSIDLGESNTYYNALPYSQYLSDLEANQILSANDRTALASLPVQTDNPANGNPDLNLTLPLLRAIGETTLGDNENDPGGFDSTISLNLPEMNLSRTGVQNSDDYDLEAVVAHEMDEVLGVGGAGSELNNTDHATGPARPMDLFRYSGPGVRSYSTSDEVSSYFSIDGGNTDLVHFNQNPEGDFGDWGDGTTPADQNGNTPPQVQDAFGDPGVDINIGVNELTALDIVGYNLTEQVPEPRSIWLLAGGAAAIAMSIRRPGRSIWKGQGYREN